MNGLHLRQGRRLSILFYYLSLLGVRLCFMFVGALALVTPPTWGDAWMAIGFGGLHIVFGGVIWRKHGG